MSILDEIRNRANQPTVPPRQDALTSQTEVSSRTEEDEDEISTVNNNQSDNNSKSELQKLSDQLAKFPEIAPRVPIRLEAPVKQALDELCAQEKITIETLLEAFYIICIDKDTVMRQVVKEAKKRLKSRKEVGNIRSSITRLGNLTKNKK
ncbi:MAG: hypothetical protein SAL70_41700 [Scytonema sp. PMC 1070.18]|nr:hypothetical protein [Scytonema sp. PMC 1070.18]